jgi:hypothetical protein
MNIMRQMIAVTIVFYGYTLLEKEKPKHFLLSVLFASLFHYSALVSTCILFLRKRSLSNKIVFVSIGISMLLGWLGIMSRASIFKGIVWQYSHHLDTQMRTDIILPLVLSFILSVFFLFVYYSSTDMLKHSLWMKLFWVAVLFNNTLVCVITGTRVVMFFSIAEVLLLPMYLQKNKFNNILIPMSITVLYLGCFLFSLLSIKSAASLPYVNVLLGIEWV